MMHDLRFAVRQLIKAPGFTLAAVLVLALGIGANTAVFSLVHTLLYAPPGYAKPHELVQLFSQDAKNPKSFRSFSYPTLNDIREQNSVFTDVAAHNVAMVGIGEKNNTRRTFADIVTANYFDVLGVKPLIGRTFTLQEEQPGQAATVAVVSYSYWVRQNRNPSILGSQLQINGRFYTIIGVLPRTFTGTLAVLSPEVWVPLSAFEFVINDFANDGERVAREPHRTTPDVDRALARRRYSSRRRAGAEDTRGESRARLSRRAERPDDHHAPALALLDQRLSAR